VQLQQLDFAKRRLRLARRLQKLAVRRDVPVGVWMERSREMVIDYAVRCAAFLRAWTRKEAYLKATGEGLRERLQLIEVALDGATP
jgi:hypothetical protein